ncbi:MAG: hypothetical protein R2712_04010 [Vicinamibacterales bacterium]
MGRRRLEDGRRAGVDHGSCDPELNLTYWGVGNPGPDWNPSQRPGDNLYSDSVVALDADTGRLKWHFQFTPNDAYDYDAVQVPVLVDREWHGAPMKLMLWANRNGYFYVLDRVTGRFLSGSPFVKVNWSSGLDERGRPTQTPQPGGSPTYPGNQGGTNWYPPSSPAHRALLLLCVGELPHHLPSAGSGIRRGSCSSAEASRWRRQRPGADHRHRPPRPHQYVDRRGR